MDMDNRIKIYETAKSLLGKNLCGTQHLYGCALSVTNVLRQAGIKIDSIAGTALLYETFQSSGLFSPVSEFQSTFGDIIISPTGLSYLGPEIHGHVGCLGKYGIMSNNSWNGLWQENYSLQTWHQFFGGQRGLPVFFFRAS